MIFKNKAHEAAYHDYVDRLNKNNRNIDSYARACLYLLALSDTVRRHVDDCFDFNGEMLKDGIFEHGWQTGSTERITHLAANLFTGNTDLDAENPEDYSPAYLCADIEDVPYFCEAMKIFAGL